VASGEEQALGGQGSGRARAAAIFVASACAFGLYRAVSLRWVSDDAFVSFRYAQHLVRGHGLVFNVGERVEGYTNFLWTMMLAAGMRVGLEPILLSEVMGLACFVALLGLYLGLHRRLAREVTEPGPLPLLPVTALCLATALHVEVFATSGLETILFTLLASCGFVALVLAERPIHHAAAGLAFSLATMTRPDGALLYAGAFAAAAVLALPARRWRDLVALAAPAIVVYLPYFAWRFSYYGYPFPNTFYAKVGTEGHLARGVVYVRAFFLSYPVLLPAPFALALVLVAWLRRRPGVLGWLASPAPRAARAAVLCAGLLAAYFFFIVRVGGDFMFARFMVPIVPFLAMSFELFLLGARPALRLAVGAALPVALVACGAWHDAYARRYAPTIGEERQAYPPGAVVEAQTKGATLERHLHGTTATVIFYGTQCMLAYYAEFPVGIEGYGLTDTYLARLPVKKAGRAGHEKQAPMDYLWRRGVNFVFASGSMKLPPGDEYKSIHFEDVDGQIIVYDRALMDRLAGDPGVRFVRFEGYLDRYLADLGSRPREKVRADYAAFRHFYFDKNPDPEREKAFRAYLSEGGESPPPGR
jgi:hypothetical protein